MNDERLDDGPVGRGQVGWRERVVFLLVLAAGIGGGVLLLAYAGTAYLGGLPYLSGSAKVNYTGQLVLMFAAAVGGTVLLDFAKRKRSGAGGETRVWFMALRPKTRILFMFLGLLVINAAMLPLWFRVWMPYMLLVNAAMLSAYLRVENVFTAWYGIAGGTGSLVWNRTFHP